MTIDITLCPTPDKIRFSSKSDAKRFKKSKGFKTHPYLCTCGFHHLGNWHGSADREAHRAGRNGDTSRILGTVISITMAANELNVRPELIVQLIDAGAINTVTGDKGQTRVPTTEVERLRKLTWKESA